TRGWTPGFSFCRCPRLGGLAYEIGIPTFGREIHCIRRRGSLRWGFVRWWQADRLRYGERLGLDPIADQCQHAEEGDPDDQEIRQYGHSHCLTLRRGNSFRGWIWVEGIPKSVL